MAQLDKDIEDFERTLDKKLQKRKMDAMQRKRKQVMDQRGYSTDNPIFDNPDVVEIGEMQKRNAEELHRLIEEAKQTEKQQKKFQKDLKVSIDDTKKMNLEIKKQINRENIPRNYYDGEISDTNIFDKPNVFDIGATIRNLTHDRKRQEEGRETYQRSRERQIANEMVSGSHIDISDAEKLLSSAEKGGIPYEDLSKYSQKARSIMNNSKVVFEKYGDSSGIEKCNKLSQRIARLDEKFIENTRKAAYGDNPSEKEREKAKKWIADKYRANVEDVRLPRAVAWGKREIDKIAKDEDNKLGIRKKVESLTIDFNAKSLLESRKNLEKEINKIKEEREQKREKLSHMNYGNDNKTLFEEVQGKIKNDSDLVAEKEKELGELDKKIAIAQNNISEEAKKLAHQADGIRDIIMGEVEGVVNDACKKYYINRGDLILQLRESLQKFAEAEIGHMLQNDYQTIYSGTTGFFKKYYSHAGAIYGHTGAAFGKFDRFLGVIEEIVYELIFGPMVIGAGLVLGLYLIISISNTNMINDPGLIVASLIMAFIYIMIEAGKHFSA